MQASSTDTAYRERLERVATNRSGLWWALALQILGLLVFVLLCNFLFPTIGQDLPTGWRVALGMGVSLIPAFLWLAFFYGFDRVEPEPKQMVLTVFAAGAILVGALHAPLLNGIFQLDSWLYTTWWSRLLGGIFIVGIFEQYLVYLAVRYLVYHHPEFDERVDGVVYAVAAGLGIATVVNFIYVAERGGVDMDIGSLRIVINTLAYASFAAILGYFIGQSRFEKTPVWYLPLGLSLAAFGNGLLFYFLEGNRSSLARGLPWTDLLLAAIVAVVALLVAFWLVARANQETLRIMRGEVAPAANPAQQPRTTPKSPSFRPDFVGQPIATRKDNPPALEKGAPQDNPSSPQSSAQDEQGAQDE